MSVAARALPALDRNREAGARRDTLAGRLAFTGAWLGVLAGTLELEIGPDIRSWIGGKLDTTRLGWTTIVLSLLALTAARTLRSDAGRHRVAIAFGLLAPALICFTTVGRLWYLPGALLLVAGGLVAAGTTRDELARAIDAQHWRVGLLALCIGYYVFLGAVALGVAGAAAVAGGLLIAASARVAARSRRTAYALLLAGALPFAALTWWSAITPAIAVATLVVGRSVIRNAGTP